MKEFRIRIEVDEFCGEELKDNPFFSDPSDLNEINYSFDELWEIKKKLDEYVNQAMYLMFKKTQGNNL